MKIQINGFDIEINTEEANMTVKVLDANGKELSNNTYTQSSTQDEVTPVDMPSAEDTATTEPAAEETPAPEETPETTEETPAEGAVEEPAVGESFMPDFDTFKKLRKEGKL